jgi:hypothetical protein
MKTSEILKKAWALIDAPEKWCQFRYINAAGQRCSVGALISAVGGEVYAGLSRINGSPMQVDFDRGVQSLALAVPPTPKYCAGDIIGFNDHYSWEAVRTVWMSAIEIAENQEIAEEIRQMAVPFEEPPEQPQPEPEPEQVPA